MSGQKWIIGETGGMLFWQFFVFLDKQGDNQLHKKNLILGDSYTVICKLPKFGIALKYNNIYVRIQVYKVNECSTIFTLG
jgi:hypothetical protein